MNRSVINVMIAAGLLSAGAGVGAAPALADRSDRAGGPATADTQDDTKYDTTYDSAGGAPGDDGIPRSPRSKRADRTGQGRPVVWPCQSDWTCLELRRNRNNLIGYALRGATSLAPPVILATPAVVEPALDVAALTKPDIAAALGPAPVEQSVPSYPAFVPAGPPPAVAAPAAPIAAAPAPARPPAVVSTAPAPAAVPEPPRAPASDSDSLLRLGYPEELRHADLHAVASVALPGLAALAGVTALGGLVGYRQARAGYVLRTAGAGRFLQ